MEFWKLLYFISTPVKHSDDGRKGDRNM